MYAPSTTNGLELTSAEHCSAVLSDRSIYIPLRNTPGYITHLFSYGFVVIYVMVFILLSMLAGLLSYKALHVHIVTL